MARLLGVRTGRFSLIPQQVEERRLQLGYVETAQSDVIRDALIGAAPLIAGGIVVAYIGFVRFDLPAIWMGVRAEDLQSWWLIVSKIYRNPDFWLWVYLAFVISSTMMPSKSDRRAWLPIGAIVALLLGVSLLAGVGPWLMLHLATGVEQAISVDSICICHQRNPSSDHLAPMPVITGYTGTCYRTETGLINFSTG